MMNLSFAGFLWENPCLPGTLLDPPLGLTPTQGHLSQLP